MENQQLPQPEGEAPSHPLDQTPPKAGDEPLIRLVNAILDRVDRPLSW